MMDKREMIERAFLSLFDDEWAAHPNKYDTWYLGDYIHADNLIDALADQAIVIDGELKHHETPEGKWTNFYYGEGGRLVATVASGEHIGTARKALAIILPLEVKD